MRLRLVLVAFAACVVAPALAQPAPAPAPGRIPTVTRLVKLFTGLEMDLVARTHAKDLSALDALLDPSFELRAGDAPGMPVPRDAWIRDARAASSREPPRIEQMAVHDLGNVALVSFREVIAGARKSKVNRFIVDCWKRDGNEWKLLIRYASTSEKGLGHTPLPRIDKRY
jgi:hypothetical protein